MFSLGGDQGHFLILLGIRGIGVGNAQHFLLVGFQGKFCGKCVLGKFCYLPATSWLILRCHHHLFSQGHWGCIRGLDGPGMTAVWEIISQIPLTSVLENVALKHVCLSCMEIRWSLYTINHVSWQEARGFSDSRCYIFQTHMTKLLLVGSPPTRWGICHWIILD